MLLHDVFGALAGEPAEASHVFGDGASFAACPAAARSFRMT